VQAPGTLDVIGLVGLDELVVALVECLVILPEVAEGVAVEIAPLGGIEPVGQDSVAG
jgi:hypothetical protein